MSIVKQCQREYEKDDWVYPAQVLLRTDGYGKSLSLMNELFAVAKEDFPFLQQKDVRIAHYGGDRIKGFMGIEFELPKGYSVPACYEDIYAMPPTL